MKKEKVGNGKDKKEIKKEETPKNKKNDRPTIIIVVIMLVLIISVFLVNWIVQERKEFEYNGLKFYKEKEGSITYYKSLLGYVTASGEEIPFILKLRNDPRKLEEIPVEGIIRLKEEAILTFSPEIVNCSNTYVTMIDFSRTLKAFGIKASGATINEDYARENDIPLADCRSSLNKTVIVMKEGNETKISQEKIFFENCYIMEISDCQVQESFERFMLKFIGESILNI